MSSPPPPAQASILRVALFCLAMAVLASICNAAMDKISFHYDSSVFASPQLLPYRGWLDPRLSWRNKWRNGNRAEGEAFLLSSTAFVFVTDAWHLLKGIAKASLILALMAPFTLLYRLSVLSWCGVYLALNLLSGIVFEMFFAGLLAA
ncbi:MAG TPA: hypothetical protein VK970_01070 [Candidatus Methylacidiphilales bacterium]|nr:hypothetical protein [Candidatus Methylacidiphilales bacterium]